MQAPTSLDKTEHAGDDDQASYQSVESAGTFGSQHSKKKVQKNETTTKFKKAPGAPRRFKSAFIFFSTEKHKEIRLSMGKRGSKEKTTNVAKMVSEAWRALPQNEREVWEEKARRDKARYEVEKSMYSGPWKVPANTKTPKDPNAPKRPMSAFLSYSNSKRAAVKRANPSVNNAEVSRILSRMWKEAPADIRQHHIDKEFKLRQIYKVAMNEWREKQKKIKAKERQDREDIALKALDSHGARGGGINDGTDFYPKHSRPADNQCDINHETSLLSAMSAARRREINHSDGDPQLAASSAFLNQQAAQRDSYLNPGMTTQMLLNARQGMSGGMNSTGLLNEHGSYGYSGQQHDFSSMMGQGAGGHPGLYDGRGYFASRNTFGDSSFGHHAAAAAAAYGSGIVDNQSIHSDWHPGRLGPSFARGNGAAMPQDAMSSPYPPASSDHQGGNQDQQHRTSFHGQSGQY